MRDQLPITDWSKFRQPDDPELEATLNSQREAYALAIEGMMDKSAEAFSDPSLGQFPVQDMALFAVFLATVKMVELSGQPLERRNILSALRFLLKRAEKEIPTQIEQLIDSVQHRQIGYS